MVAVGLFMRALTYSKQSERLRVGLHCGHHVSSCIDNVPLHDYRVGGQQQNLVGEYGQEFLLAAKTTGEFVSPHPEMPNYQL